MDIPTNRARVATLAGVVLSCSLLALFFASSYGKQLALPGPLASVHAPLEQDCEVCHASEFDSIQHPLSGWVTSDLDLAQSRLCLDCHALGEHPLGPHGWSREDARQHRAIAASRVETPGPYRDSAVPLSSRGQVACSACHNEHRGRANVLTSLADQQCQVCHTQSFDHFPGQHPEFSTFPYERRTGINFDHLTHIQRHFRSDLQEHAPMSCTDCHIQDETLEGFKLANFETTCAACHEDAISGSTQVDGAGLPVLAFPALDVASLKDREVAIGAWPADASEVDTPMPAITAFLLGTSENALRDLDAFEALDRLDLYQAKQRELDTVARVAWDLKRMFMRLSSDGHAGWIAMVEERLGRKLAKRERTDLIAGMPGDILSRALEEWSFDARPELEQHAAGNPPSAAHAPSSGSFQDDPERERWVSEGGWYVQHADFSLRYRPNGHADPFLRAWLDIGAQTRTKVFDELARPGSHGTCTKCHGIGEAAGTVSIHWKANDSARPLTRFSHQPHVTSNGRGDCSSCHVLDHPSDGYARSFEGRDPLAFRSNFQDMTKATCANCHEPESSSNSCLECHEYHAHSPAPRIRAPELDELLQRRAGN